jgi:IMP dehydrogenase
VTPEAAQALIDWGADCIKVGIGGGSACTTRINAGVGYPQLSALANIRNACPDAKIISDGGIVYSGDIAKALVYADAVMIGGALSGTAETPGKVFRNKQGAFYKVFQGSASARHKETTTGEPKFVEGITYEVPFKAKVKYIFKEIQEGLQSSFSYVGATNLREFKEKASFVVLSTGAMRESKL